MKMLYYRSNAEALKIIKGRSLGLCSGKPQYEKKYFEGPITWRISARAEIVDRAETSARLLKQILLKSNCRLHGEGFSPGRNSARAENPSPVCSNRVRIQPGRINGFDSLCCQISRLTGLLAETDQLFNLPCATTN